MLAFSLIWIRVATFVETSKRLNIEYNKRMYTNSTKDIQQNKEADNTSRGSREIFSRFLDFIDCTEQQQIPRPVDKGRRKMYYSTGKKKRHTIKNQLTVNKDGYILHKTTHKKGKRHDYIFTYIRITIL